MAGLPYLRKKLIDLFETTRGISLANADCVISNGAKHSLSNIVAALIDPGDEVVLLCPYWVSYPEIVTLFGGVPKVVSASITTNFTPDMADIERAFTKKTKALVINSPNNPAGTHYPQSWMQDLAALLLKHPHVWAISDEIYDDLCYQGPRPTYFYQGVPELLERALIVNGISKSLASTGLRIGYTFAPKLLAQTLRKIQGHTASNANSLIQQALLHFDFSSKARYLEPIKAHLKKNEEILRQTLGAVPSPPPLYRATSAFYYLVQFDDPDSKDRSLEWTEALLTNTPWPAFPARPSAWPTRPALLWPPKQRILKRPAALSPLF